MDKLPAQLPAKAGQRADMDRAERDVRRMEGIICSMTPLERRKPELHQGHAASAASPPAPACRCRKSTACSTSSSRCSGMMKKMKGGGLMKMMKRMGGMKGIGGHALRRRAIDIAPRNQQRKR